VVTRGYSAVGHMRQAVAQVPALFCSPYARLITAAEIALDEAVAAGRVLSVLTHKAMES